MNTHGSWVCLEIKKHKTEWHMEIFLALSGKV